MFDIKYIKNDQIFHIDVNVKEVPSPGEIVSIEDRNYSKSFHLVEKVSIKGKYNAEIFCK
jgi:hypothetical protein